MRDTALAILIGAYHVLLEPTWLQVLVPTREYVEHIERTARRQRLQRAVKPSLK